MLNGTFLDGLSAGDVTDDPIDGASGLAASASNIDVLWTHNDAGGSNQIFAINTNGAILGTFTLTGAGAVDYEDIAIGPGPLSGISYLYTGDIGDDSADRASGIEVYRVAEPLVDANGGSEQSVILTSVDTITLTYPDGPRDAEVLLVDPLTGELFVISKSPQSNVYRAPAPGAGDVEITLELMASLSWSEASAGAVSPTGLEVLLKSDSTVYLYDRNFGDDLWDVVGGTTFINPPYTPEPNGEAITFDADGQHYYSLSESEGAGPQPLLFYRRAGEVGTSYIFRNGISPDSTYTGNDDVELRQYEPETNFGSASSIVVDGDEPGGTGQDTVSLLRWDVSAIPDSSIVTTAAINLNVTNPTSQSYALYEVLRDWVEGDATWLNATSSQTWQGTGASGASDRGATAVGTLGPISTGAVIIDLNAAGLAMVQGWIDGTLPNNGIIIADGSRNDGVDFNSSETTHFADWPALLITTDATLLPQYTVNHAPRLQLGNAPLVGYGGADSDQVQLMLQSRPLGSGLEDTFVAQFRPSGDALWSNAGPVSTSDTGVQSRINHFVEFIGLNFDSDYEYRLRHIRSGHILTTYQNSFHSRLAAADAAPFTFATYGDSADTSVVQNFRLVQDRINQINPAFAVLLGDNVYSNGTHVEFDARLDPIVNPEAAAWQATHIDYYSMGNHDDSTSLGQPSEDNYAVPIQVAGQNVPFGPDVTEEPEHNYSFDYGTVHFVTFDTNDHGDDQQLDQRLQYVEDDLMASSADWKIVFGHHPIAGVPDKPENPSQYYYQQVVQRLRDAGADLFMVGHSHTYSWTYPLLGETNGEATFINDTDKDYTKGAGLVQLVSGAGGRSLRPGDYSQIDFVASGYTTNNGMEYGTALINVTPDQLQVSYVAADDGAVIDSFTITAIPGDFNYDTVVDGVDIDLLRQAISDSDTSPRFDLNDDMVLDSGDVDMLVVTILGTAYGDITLDRIVDAEDLLILRPNSGASTPTGGLPWSQGDVNGDGVIDQLDLETLRTEFGFTNVADLGNSDLDALRAAINTGSSDDRFDFDGDASITVDDLGYLVHEVLATTSGDADLDGEASFEDFVRLTNNFGRTNTGWAQANFNLDSDTNFQDYVLLVNSVGMGDSVSVQTSSKLILPPPGSGSASRGAVDSVEPAPIGDFLTEPSFALHAEHIIEEVHSGPSAAEIPATRPARSAARAGAYLDLIDAVIISEMNDG